MRRVWLAMAILLGCMCVVSEAICDVVELKTGERIEGKIKETSETSVTIEIGGQTLRFDRGQVRSIHIGTQQLSSPQPSPIHEVLSALKSLGSAVKGGVIYQDYARRVSDTKVLIDRLVEQMGSEDILVRNVLSRAMELLDGKELATARRSRGRLYQDMEQNDNAKEDLKAAVVLDGANIPLRYEYATLLARLNDVPAARAEYERIIEADPDLKSEEARLSFTNLQLLPGS